MCRENGKYVIEFKLMQKLAWERVFFFEQMGIGLDNYKGKDFMSRVAVSLGIEI